MLVASGKQEGRGPTVLPDDADAPHIEHSGAGTPCSRHPAHADMVATAPRLRNKKKRPIFVRIPTRPHSRRGCAHTSSHAFAADQQGVASALCGSSASLRHVLGACCKQRRIHMVHKGFRSLGRHHKLSVLAGRGVAKWLDCIDMASTASLAKTAR